MYTISNRLKMTSIVLMIAGLIGVSYGFWDSHRYKTVDDVKELLAAEAHHDGHGEAHDAGHGDSHAEAHHDETHATGHDAHEEHAEEGHHMSHEEHVLHQIHNRPWAALYVGAFFFFMIALGVLAFYAIQYAAQAGWSPVLFLSLIHI